MISAKSFFIAFALILISIPRMFSQVDDIPSYYLRLNPTFEHIAIHIDIIGDENENSSLDIEFRPSGSSAYIPGAICLRSTPDMIVDGNALNMNFHAGSAMHLWPNTEYDLRLTLTDPDGGSAIIDTSISTRKFPTYENSQDTLYVIPGISGGDGTIANPYQGIQTAIDFAVAGNIVELADGIYDPFTLNESGTADLPIVIRSTNLHGAIIDGKNTDRGVVTLGSFDDSIQYVIMDGLEIKNGKWGIDAQNTQYLSIINNKINDVDWGIYNRRGNGWEHDQFIHNNEIIGRTPWPQTNGEIPSERGVDIRGNRNVISYNSISDFGDGITTDGQPYKVSFALDIHHNEITRIVDDLIEIDGSVSNTRIYKNRVYNGRMGVSVAPVFGGPAYIFRNEMYNLETSAIKMNRKPAGIIMLNNSVVKLTKGMTSNAGWQNTIFKNNTVLSEHYVMEEYGLVTGSMDDWDNNGYRSERSGNSGGPWFKWDNIRYDNISAINSSGITEGNSIEIDYSDFINVSLPTAYATESFPINQNFNLTSTSSLVDAGIYFNNIFDTDSIDGIPDIGVYELGQPTVDYGHDFSLICSNTDVTEKLWNGSQNSAWFEPENWTPCGIPTTETVVTIPGNLFKYPYINSTTSISGLILENKAKIDIINNAVFIIED